MPKVTRQMYITAVIALLDNVGYKVDEKRGGKLVATKAQRVLLIDPVGKNLPYRGKDGSECFEWETWIDPERIDRLEAEAGLIDADPWLAFCYAITDPRYRSNFQTLEKIGDLTFGVRAITTASFRRSMVTRSPSWEKVNLPRDSVADLTVDVAAL